MLELTMERKTKSKKIIIRKKAKDVRRKGKNGLTIEENAPAVVTIGIERSEGSGKLERELVSEREEERTMLFATMEFSVTPTLKNIS